MADQPPPTLRRYDNFRRSESLGVMWSLTRDGVLLRCDLTTHPLGWELRLVAGTTFSRSQVCKTEAGVFDVAEAWKAEAVEKGWAL
jgi:hypothetical protein